MVELTEGRFGIVGHVHADQLLIDTGTAAALIAGQFPQWSPLPVRPVPSAGTVNALFRVGDELVARFPLRPGDPADVLPELRREAAAGAEIAGATRWPTPLPKAIGRAGHGYPLAWAVQSWLPGRVAWGRPLDEDFAADLAGFVRDLRAVPTRGRRFEGTGRGGALTDHDAWLEHCFERSIGLVDVPRLRTLWQRLRILPGRVEVMSHGDLTPGNVLVGENGGLAGVIDVGGFGPADAGLDLVAAWTLFDEGPRQRFRAELATDDPRADALDWERGRAWALQQAMGLVWYYRETNPAMHTLGMTTIERLLG